MRTHKIASTPHDYSEGIAEGLAALLDGTEVSEILHATTVGSNCFAKALPSTGEGGLAWGNTLSIARQKSLNNCVRYAGRSGGTPKTCQVVMAKCKN